MSIWHVAEGYTGIIRDMNAVNNRQSFRRQSYALNKKVYFGPVTNCSKMWQRRFEKGFTSRVYLHWLTLLGKFREWPDVDEHPLYKGKARGERALFFCRTFDEHDNFERINAFGPYGKSM
jgi:hypothetical protein